MDPLLGLPLHLAVSGRGYGRDDNLQRGPVRRRAREREQAGGGQGAGCEGAHELCPLCAQGEDTG